MTSGFPSRSVRQARSAVGAVAVGRPGLLDGTGAPPAGGGLVPCAISVRAATAPGMDRTDELWTDELWRPAFPTPELVHTAADLLPTITETGGRGAVLGEGPR